MFSQLAETMDDKAAKKILTKNPINQFKELFGKNLVLIYLPTI